MDTIIIKHIIEEGKINISFDLQQGIISFPAIDLDIKTDIDLNSLLLKLTNFVEVNKKIEFQFEDINNLVESSAKINLVKETLEEIYIKFNEQIISTTIIN